MSRWTVVALAAATWLAAAAHAQAATEPRFEGTLIQITGRAEIEVANDEAVANFFVEVQDGDLVQAQSAVNRRVAEASRSLRRSDPGAEVHTSGYSSHPIYRHDAGRRPVAWRVRQSLTVRTTDLGGLARTVAEAQQHAALGSIDFRLSRDAREKLEAELIRRALANLNARVAAAAQALQVAPAQIRIEELDFGVRAGEGPPIVSLARAATLAAEAVPEPQFDAGRSLQQLTVTARVRFLRP